MLTIIKASNTIIDLLALQGGITYTTVGVTLCRRNCHVDPYKIEACFRTFRERSGRVLDSRQRGRGIEPHRRHCIVVLEQDTFILYSLVLVQPRKTRPCLTERLLMGR